MKRSCRAGVWLVLGPALVLSLVACSKQAAPVTPPTAPAVALETVRVATAPTAQQQRFDGVVEAVRQANIAAQTGGRVVELPFDVGDHVKPGDVLVRLTATEQHAQTASAQAALTEAQARAREAGLQYTRIRDLFDRQLVAKSQYDRARADADAAQARAEAARGQLTQAREQADYTAVSAPYAGIVVRRDIEIGETVAPGRALLTVLALEPLRVAADIPQQSIAALRSARQLQVILADGSVVVAGALRIAPAADAATRSFRVLADLPVGGGLAPGTIVKLAFAAGEAEQLAVPLAALVQRAELNAVYVVDDSQRVSLRYVRVGRPDAAGHVPILAGLDAGERVALDPLAAAAAYRRQRAADRSK